MTKLYLSILLGLIALGAIASAATGRRTSHKNTDALTHLKATLLQVQDKINEQGEINYVMMSDNAQGQHVRDEFTISTFRAIADYHSCSIEADSLLVANGKEQSKRHTALDLKKVHAIYVKTQTQAVSEQSARAGVTAWRGVISPESYVLQTYQYGGDLSGMFFFRERRAATAAAKDMSKVIELCGGKKGAFSAEHADGR